jgi:hypothetical protein
MARPNRENEMTPSHWALGIIAIVLLIVATAGVVHYAVYGSVLP